MAPLLQAPPRRRATPAALPADALRRHRDQLYRLLARDWAAPDRREEFDAHFRGLPDRYWARVDAAAVRWHLELFRAFYQHLATDGARVLVPVVRWRHFPDRKLTEVAVCTWDRPGLLARVAQAFALAGINILQAQIFCRADNVMLNLFQVADRQFDFVPRERLLEETVKTLRFLATAAPAVALPELDVTAAGDAWVEFDVISSPAYTVLMIETGDRPGLLYGVFRALHGAGLLVVQALAVTEHGVAACVFYLTDTAGGKVTDVGQLQSLRERLGRAMAAPAA